MKYGCIGEKLGHSFSKTIHNMLGYDYELKEIAKDALDTFMNARDFLAINVTIPYKQSVIPYLDYIDDSAKAIGAVNTIVNKDGKLFGYNTDFYGMTKLLEKAGIDPCGKRCAVLGSGGTSKTANAVLESLGAKSIMRVSRTAKDGACDYDTLYAKGAEIIINTTPCGMFPNLKGAACDLERLPDVTGVADAVYNPLRSELVMKALQKGIRAIGGLYMLVAQAVRASELFFDKTYDDGVIDNVYNELARQKESVVLIGMAGVGKTTVGKELAKRLSKPFYDTDDEIVRIDGRSIPDIFANSGEDYFRRLESEVIYGLSSLGSAVIATGGGAVKNPENILRLKQNGKVVLLQRDIDDIPATADRPLSNDREKLVKLYNERKPLYLAAADIKLECKNGVKNTADMLEKML